jgi:hypothetical protein
MRGAICRKHYIRNRKYGSPYLGEVDPSRYHGLKHTSEYRTWNAMKTRCYNPKSNRFQYYGGRGITVCKRWRDSFAAFYADMGPKPGPEYSIDRIKVNGNYTPRNCRWATPSEQALNKQAHASPVTH